VKLELDKVDLVTELLPTQGLTVGYGPSGCGKTFFFVDLACHVASGLPWYERAIEAGPVIYVAAEAPVSVERRVVAWKSRHCSPGDDGDGQNMPATPLDVAIVQAGIDLLAGDAKRVVELGQAIAAEREPVRLVVIDTLARAMTGNENAPEDMGRFVAACADIRESLGCHVLIVHHCGKNEARGARGHSSLRAATDVEIEVASGDGSVRTARVTKHRDEAAGTVFAFSLDVVELGTNRQGRKVTTCVAAEAEANTLEIRRMEPKLSKCGRIAMDALAKAVRDCGAPPPATVDTSSAKLAVTLDQWRQYFRLAGGYSDEEAKRSTFRSALSRGKKSAIASGRARVWGDYAWLASND
jgi:RecA-family ATPase